MDNKKVLRLFFMIVMFLLMLWGFSDGKNDRKLSEHKDVIELAQ